jgi:hypothetical protein
VLGLPARTLPDFPQGGARCSPTRGCGRSWSAWSATTAFVRFSGGGGSRGSIGAVTLEDGEKRVLARWRGGEGELPEALAAPVWGRYALFRGHPRITGVLMWDVKERCVLVAGERGGEKFDQVLVSKLVTGARQASLRETATQSEQRPCA